MDLKRELRRRQWPQKPTNAEYGADTFVTEGRMFTRALQMQQSLSEPIPPGECAITSLAAAPDGQVYGATSGACSHLFCYSPAPETDGVRDLGVIPGARAVRGALVVGADGTVLGGVSEALDGKKEGGLFRLESHARRWARRKAAAKKPRRRGVHGRHFTDENLLPPPVPGECVAALAIDRPRRLAYGLSSGSATLFSVDMDSGDVSVKGTMTDDVNFSRTLVLDRDGNVYGAGALGRLIRYDPERGQIEPLDLALPSVAGREFYNRLDSAALDPATGVIYGGGSADGVIFAFDPRQTTIRSLGKVMAEPRCRAITVGLDGRVYGIAGEPDGMGHLFCYDPHVPELRDLGAPTASSERSWHGYEFEAACTGPNGEIYLGESDRISHLFIYFPPIRPPQPPQPSQK